MNKTKKLLCILLAGMLLFALAACGDGESASKSKGTTAKSAEDEVREVVDGFFENVFTLNMDEASKFLASGSEQDLPFKSRDDLMNKAFEAMEEGAGEMAEALEPYRDDLKDLFNHVIDGMVDKMTYEIEDCKADGDKATAKVKTTIVTGNPFESLNFDDIDFDFESYLADLAAGGKISESSSMEEMMGAIMPKILEVLTDTIDTRLEDIETETEEEEIELVKEDGKWYITDESGDSVFDSLDLAGLAS